MRMNAWFHHVARYCTQLLGSVYSFIFFVVSIMVWVMAGTIFQWSDTWQISYMNGLTILTMLVVVLQLYMARITEAKVDELLKGTPGASNRAILLEEGTREDFTQLEDEHRQHRQDCEES